MEFFQLAEERYSCRKFSDREIEKEKLDKLAKLASICPSACNNQPSKVYFIKDKKAELEETFKFRFNCPMYILVTGNRDKAWHNGYFNDKDSSEVDAAIILTHLMLGAKELGLDSCWIGSFDIKAVNKIEGIGKDEEAIGILAIGYADKDAEVSANHNKKLHIDEVVKYL